MLSQSTATLCEFLRICCFNFDCSILESVKPLFTPTPEQEIKEICDEYVKIPMEETQESLNVAIAAAILMYNGYVGGES